MGLTVHVPNSRVKEQTPVGLTVHVPNSRVKEQTPVGLPQLLM